MTKVVAVVPAHNEAEQISQTLLSLKRQSVPPTRIIVSADNCTDLTADIARSFNGVEVFETVGNRSKKAGALNQALAYVLPELDADDVILVMDADSALANDFIEIALPMVEEHGAVSGAYTARKMKGLVPFLQMVEYTQERYKIARRKAKVNVLSGAAAVFQAKYLDCVAYFRGKELPGVNGQIYAEDSLTEDFELTLALQSLGVAPISPKNLVVETDVMRDWRSLFGQRLRWQRGYLETLVKYPFRETWLLWLRQAGVYLLSVLPGLVAGLTVATWIRVDNVSFSWVWLSITPIFMISEAVAARRSGWRGTLFAASVLPLMAYNSFRAFVYWRSLGEALRNRESAWT
jgi:cellulose synthase/poly-beta-1,6-N-acetylglucosamine synthase-like glycosyltransferase